MVEQMNLPTSSRRARTLLHELGAGSKPTCIGPSISANAVAGHIVTTSKLPQDCCYTIRIKQDLRALKDTATIIPCSNPFTVDEVNKAISDIKPVNAPVEDDIDPEFLKIL